MRRILFSIFALVFLLSSFAGAGDGKGCSEAAKKACAAAKTKAGCSAKKAEMVSVRNLQESDEKTKKDHICPDAGGRAALQVFHESMHPLHMALSEQNYDTVREGLPGLLEASKALDKYKCEGYDKCSRECRKTFDSRKKELMKAVRDLKKACKGKDNEKMTASFDKMHEAYITFANTCSH
ncbi:MAG: hypothetical protein JSU85_08750 [Candidatus Zixiibacteriota bacterium]|nr:MAG: hypothetical protein JSU85_08750 [candidate division Zixibacteria bacterium]